MGRHQDADPQKQQTISRDGTLLNKMINDLDLIMLNCSTKCEGLYIQGLIQKT